MASILSLTLHPKVSTLPVRLSFLSVLVCLLPLSVFGQSDSTAVDTAQYGPHTTKYFFKDDVYRDTLVYQMLDSGLAGIHNYDNLYRDGIAWQNLGNIGTASKPLYWQQPDRIGYRLGFSAYDQYANEMKNVRYFDTRSSYSELYYLQSVFVSTGEQIFKADVSRNVNPYLNFGASYKRIVAQKQLAEARQEDKQSDSHLIQLNGSYRPRQGKYTALVDYTIFTHEVYESGGVLPEPGTGPDDWFDNVSEESYLGTQARSSDRRRVFNGYQQLRLAGKGLTAFHEIKYETRVNQYVDREITSNRLNGPLLNYNYTLLDPNYTEYLTHYRHIDNRAGLKSSSKYHFLAAWVERRDHRFEWGNQYNLYVPSPKTTFAEQFVGAEASGTFFDSVLVTAKAEALLFMNHGNEFASRQFSPNGDHRFSLRARYRFAEAGAERMNYTPAITEQFTDNNHFFWNNNFTGTSVDRLWGALNLTRGVHRLKINAGIDNINRLVYFNQNAEPEQHESGIALINAGVKGSTAFGIFGAETDFQYHARSGADIVRFPAFFNFSRIYIQGRVFKNRLQMMAGLESRFTSGYYADAYMPVTGRFFLQDEFYLKDYAVINFFASCKLDRARLFIRATHLNEQFDGSPGYFITPYYPGLRRSFQFGVYWMFFD